MCESTPQTGRGGTVARSDAAGSSIWLRWKGRRSGAFSRRPSRPVVETDTVTQNVFRETPDIVADLRKADRDCVERASRAGTCRAV